MTLACEEDVYSKLVEVVTVAHVDDDNSLVQIWKVKFGHKAKFLSTGFQGLVKILKLMLRQDFKMMFGHYFATDTYDMKFNLGRDCEAWFGQDF